METTDGDADTSSLLLLVLAYMNDTTCCSRDIVSTDRPLPLHDSMIMMIHNDCMYACTHSSDMIPSNKLVGPRLKLVTEYSYNRLSSLLLH